MTYVGDMTIHATHVRMYIYMYIDECSATVGNASPCDHHGALMLGKIRCQPINTCMDLCSSLQNAHLKMFLKHGSTVS